MNIRDTLLSRTPRTPSWVVALALAAVTGGSGCTREFFRDWANQDASLQVFEMSRDPRFRLDTFSVDPPALSRFADPYDPDVPPAPPDDRATEALSTVPQWPDNRLIVPVEGTGYLDMMDAFGRYQAPPKPPAAAPRPLPTLPPAPPLPPAGSPAPFAPRPNGNSGTNPGGMSPIPLPVSPAANPAVSRTTPPPVQERLRDFGVKVAAFQHTGLPMPVPVAARQPAGTRERSPGLPVPPIGGDPDPVDQDLSKPINPRPDLTPKQYRDSEELGAEMSGLMIPAITPMDECEAAGLPKGSQPYKISMAQMLQIALVNSRVYQYNLEQIYLASLAVTLQRFAFQPQFFAGLSPVTSPQLTPSAGVTGAPSLGFPGGLNPANSFFYSTRATGAPASTLSIGTVAGVGKAFDTGAKIVAGFASQLVFNFFGPNSAQPKVQSYLPMSMVIPFLRGGGRAVTLEALTLAERTLVYEIRSFAKFRQEFIVDNLVGGSFISFGTTAVSSGFSGGTGGTNEPTIGFINVLEDLILVENNRRNIAAYEHLYKVFLALKEGESSGLTPLQVDQVGQNIQSARLSYVSSRLTYRNDLDSFKMQLGLPPDLTMILDRRLTMPFKRVFDLIDDWGRDPKRELSDLPKFTAQLPNLEDIVVDGRSVLGIYPEGHPQADEDKLNDLYLAGERLALEHRLDLMNARAQLYDLWRQIRVTANALKGVFNVAITNQYITQPATTNPFAFLDQAKQFSLVINAELPLVRMAERNNFRTALINYQRQRRLLQNQEDTVKLQVRFDIRGVQQLYLTYEIYRKNIVYFARLKDQAIEQIIAPPAGGANVALAATQTTNLVGFQGSLISSENSLTTTWQTYEVARLVLYRDLGILPYDEWEAISELFPGEYNPTPSGDVSAVPAVAGASRPAGAVPTDPAQERRRR